MANRTVIIAGATGLVGSEILGGLLADEGVANVHSFGRKAPEIEHPKLTPHVVEFTALPSLPVADELYLALGTTIKVAGSQRAFRAIDYDANLGGEVGTDCWRQEGGLGERNGSRSQVEDLL